MLTHQNLKVYAKSLASFAAADDWLLHWEQRPAVVDQLGRASVKR